MKRGDFFVFEGINGCGKGTQLKDFTEHVYDLDKSSTIFRTREPNEFDNNGQLARAMLFRDGDPYSNNTKAVEYFAENRRTHNGIFVSMLERGIDVVSDRYWHSNFAFQSAQGISCKDIARANGGLRIPDLTFLIDVPVEVVFERLHMRDGADRRKFDMDRDFLGEVRNNYLELSEFLPGLIGDSSIVVIDGNQSIEGVFKEVKSAYSSFLKMRNS